jgi:hypothetical protein
MTMSAEVLKRNNNYTGEINVEDYGDWVDAQDPLTGQIIKVWEPYPNLPSTPDVDESVLYTRVPCVARGIVDGGIRVAGTTQRMGQTYENIDFVHMWIPGGITVTKNDRITNIRDPKGRVRWLDEEYADELGHLRSSVFNVNGVVPLFDAFNNVREWFLLLENVQVPQEA